MSTQMFSLSLFVIISAPSICFAMKQITHKASTGIRRSAQKVNIPKRKHVTPITSEEFERQSKEQLNSYKFLYTTWMDNISRTNYHAERIIEYQKKRLQPYWYDRFFPFLKDRRIQQAKDDIKEKENIITSGEKDMRILLDNWANVENQLKKKTAEDL